MIKYILLFALTAQLVSGAEKREVLVDEDGVVVAPVNLWEANAEGIKGALSVGDVAEWLPMATRTTAGLVTITADSEMVNPYDVEKAVSSGALLRWWDEEQMNPIRPFGGGLSNVAYGFKYHSGESSSTGIFSGSGSSLSAAIEGTERMTLTESGVVIHGGATLMGSFYVDGHTTLGIAPETSLTINSGTLSAPNATGTASDRIANVGALDARYKWLLRPEDISISNFSNAITGTSGGSVEIRPGYARLRTPTGSGQAWMKLSLWGGGAPGQMGATSFPYNRNFKVTLKWTMSGDSDSWQQILLPVGGQWEGQQSARYPAPYKAVGWMIGGGYIFPTIQQGIGPITSITRNANIATVTTSLPHGLTPGTAVQMEGQTPTSFESGAYITKINEYTFTYPNSGVNVTATQNGYITVFDNVGMGRQVPGFSSSTNSYESAPSCQATIEFKDGTVYWSFNGVAFGNLGGMPTTTSGEQYLGITNMADDVNGPNNFDLLNITLQAR